MKTLKQRLDQIDYKELFGENLRQYEAIINELAPTDSPSNNLVEFEEYKAAPGFDPADNFRLNTIVITDLVPLRTTKIEVRSARMHNRQIESAQSRAGQGTYYLIKKSAFNDI